MIYLYTKNAYLKFLILCCMFKIDLYSKTLCCIQTCNVFYLYSIACQYLCDIRSEVCFYLHKRNKCMNFMMYQNKMPLRIYLVMGEGLVIGMSRVRIPLPANQERAYLVWKGSYIDIFGCQHPFCFVDRLARKSSYVMALMPDRIKVGVRSGHATMSWTYIIEIMKTKQTDEISTVQTF